MSRAPNDECRRWLAGQIRAALAAAPSGVNPDSFVVGWLTSAAGMTPIERAELDKLLAPGGVL